MKQQFDVTGMSCAACSAHVEKAVCALSGVQEVQVNLLAGSMTTIYDEEQTDAAAIIKSVEDAGYGASVRGETVQAKSTLADKGQDEVRVMRRRIQISFVFLALLMYLSMGSMLVQPFLLARKMP